MDIKPRVLTPEEKILVKERLLQVSQIIEKWTKEYPQFSTKEIKSFFLNKTFPFPKNSDLLIDQKVFENFREENHPHFETTLEMVVLESFAPICYNVSKSWSRRISSESDISPSAIFHDVLQDAFMSVLSSMYYYTDSNYSFSTIIIESLKRHMDRMYRYNYCKTSPRSLEDHKTAIQYNISKIKEPHITFDQIVKSMGISEDQTSRLCDVIRFVCRESNADSNNSLNLGNIIDTSSSQQEEVDFVDCVSVFKKGLSSAELSLLELTSEEIEIFKIGIDCGFRRGWQSDCAKDKSLSRQRIGQIYISAVAKLKPLLMKTFYA